jgi:ankyrin repeat protein
LHTAAKNGCNVIIEILLQHGANTEITDKYGNTPLHIAAIQCHLDIVRCLVQHNANMNAVNKGFLTPLECVEEHSNTFRQDELEKIKLFLQSVKDLQ